MKARGFAEVIGITVGIILLVAVGLQVSGGLISPLTSVRFVENQTLLGVQSGGSNRTADFASTPQLCANTFRLLNTTNGTNFQLEDANRTTTDNGTIFWSSTLTTNNFGTSARLTYSCGGPSFLTSASARTVTDLVPLFVALGALAYIAYSLLSG